MVHVESLFWASLKQIAGTEKLKLRELIVRINRDRETPNLSSAIRLYVLEHFRRLADEVAPGSGKSVKVR